MKLTKSLSFIHAADLHLDTPFKGLAKLPSALLEDVKESTFKAFDRLVERAIAHEVDFVLLVGDLFDQANQSLKAQMHLRRAFEKLQANEIDVYLSYGNHDYLDGNSFPITYPDNVHIFPSEQVTSFTFKKDNQALAEIYGFSYEKQAVTENKIAEYDIKNPNIPYHIASLHGSLYGNQAHANYAPFQLQELLERPFDYWALGHIHQREILASEPAVVYPGNIQGRHRNESGKKGCYYVSMDESGAKTIFLPLHMLVFENISIDISSCEKIEQIENEIIRSLDKFEEKTLVHLTIKSSNNQGILFEQEGLLEELITIINEMKGEGPTWQYIYKYQFIYEADQKRSGNFFAEDVLTALDDIDVQEAVSDLYHSPGNRRFLEELDEKVIKEKASQLLTYGLHRSK